MQKELANLNMLDEEEDVFREEAPVVDNEYHFCLVGRCLTNSVVHFPSLRNIMADLWHPIWGICISDLGEIRDISWAENENGPMDLVLDGENDPLYTLEGKKCHRLIGDVVVLSENDIERGINEKLASFVGQSN
ncbi:hypothetical protein J1N35_022651 [Gossypium stocksii]|uniref:DUF4283 domain-containing protein n=1 Tax=Gossypium stocksii TaxID=47602 RepID=A0A9D3VGV5_9ROSI|nr:hypothetical protein J1N35_022651 [Gossypium stocksii]